MRVPGNYERVSRKGAKEKEGRSERDEQHQTIEHIARQKNLRQKNENGFDHERHESKPRMARITRMKILCIREIRAIRGCSL
jgi:hypothetical protein